MNMNEWMFCPFSLYLLLMLKRGFIISLFHQNEAKRSRLFCRYQDGNQNPRLLLKPIQEEDEWDSPHIVRYLNVLSDQEIDKIKELSKPRVRPNKHRK